MAVKRFRLKALIEGVDKLSGPVRRMSRNVRGSVGRMRKAFGGLTAGLGGLTRGLSLVGGAGIIGGIYGAARATLSLEDAMNKVRSLPSVTEQQMTAFHKSAIAWSQKHGTSVEDYLGATYDAISAGITDTEGAIAATEVAVKVATATFTDHRTAMQSVAKLYNTMGDKSKDVNDEMARMGGILTRTQQTFQLADLNQLTDGLKYAVPWAKTFKVSVEQMTTAVGALNSAGLDGSSAGTAFRAFMTKLSEASKKLHFQIVRTKDGNIDLNATLWNLKKATEGIDPAKLGDKLADAFQIRGVPLAALLAKDAGELEKFSRGFGEAARDMDEAFRKIDESTGTKLRVLRERLRRVGADLGNRLVPIFERNMPKIERLIEKIPAAFDWVARTVSDIWSFVDALGGVKTIVAAIATIKIAAFAKALGGIPGTITGIVAGVGAIVWGIKELEKQRRGRVGMKLRTGRSLTETGLQTKQAGLVKAGIDANAKVLAEEYYRQRLVGSLTQGTAPVSKAEAAIWGAKQAMKVYQGQLLTRQKMEVEVKLSGAGAEGASVDVRRVTPGLQPTVRKGATR